MRKTICVIALVAVTLMASASDAFAQRRGGRGGGWGGFGYGGGNFGGSYFGSPSWGWGSGYYGNSYYGSPYYGRSYYSSPYYYGNGYYGDGYYSGPIYDGTVTQAPPSTYSQSFYNDPNMANITVLVPNPEAQVWFDNSPTNQRGMQRSFQTSLQQPGTYSIKARWMDNGRAVEQTREIRVQPGQSVTVDFRIAR